MKKLNILSLFFILLFFGFSCVSAQEQSPLDDEKPTVNRTRRPNLMQFLGLSGEQIQEIRRIRQNSRPLVQQAQRRLFETRKALDEAIYADNPNETEIQERLKAVQQAQSEVLAIQAQTEYEIRKILTPEQLEKFRVLRLKTMRNPKNERKPDFRPFDNRKPQNTNRRQMKRVL
jgi:P pilus assembly/Cpx signaling pathway, periplasmic inhibitor/zinc-resistance associated protein